MIVAYITAQGNAKTSEIAEHIGLSQPRVRAILSELVSEGIVAGESEGSKGCRVLQQNKFGDISDDDLIPTSEENSYIK